MPLDMALFDDFRMNFIYYFSRGRRHYACIMFQASLDMLSIVIDMDG